MTKLYLIRHAEAEGNLYRIAHGQYNSILTDRGMEQVEALRRRFADEQIDAVYSSDLCRTCTTATALYVPRKLPLHKRRDLREYHMGVWEQMSWGEIERTDREQLNELQTALNTAADTGLPLVYCAVPLKNEVLHDIDASYFSDEVGAENKEALFAMLAGVDRLTAIDASAPLLAGSLAEREQLFYKTDFHWNSRGAFAASQEIARQLAASGLIDAASIPQADAFVWSELGTEKQYQGDLNVWFSDLLPMQEDIPRFVPADPAPLSYYDSPGSTQAVPRKTIIGSGLDKNPVTYNDVFTYNLGYYRVENPNAPEARSVLLLKDSFQNATTDYFSAIFREIHVIDPRAYRETPGLSGFLAENDVDLILFFYHQNNVSPELTAFLTQ